MIIRKETPADYEAVYELVKAAFAAAEHSDGREHELVAALRKSGAFVPGLSLVAETDGILAGHILFTEIQASLNILHYFRSGGRRKCQ